MQGSKISSFKNRHVTQFIILLIINKLPPITIHFHNFLVFFLLICLSDFSLFSFHTYAFKFSFISSFVFTLHWSFKSFSIYIWSLIREMFFWRKIFIKNLVKFFFLKYFHDCRLKKIIHIWQLYTRLKCWKETGKKNLTTCERKISSCKPAFKLYHTL